MSYPINLWFPLSQCQRVASWRTLSRCKDRTWLKSADQTSIKLGHSRLQTLRSDHHQSRSHPPSHGPIPLVGGIGGGGGGVDGVPGLKTNIQGCCVVTLAGWSRLVAPCSQSVPFCPWQRSHLSTTRSVHSPRITSNE